MAGKKEQQQDNRIKRSDIQNALADENPIRDASIIQPTGMVMDTMPSSQPDGTYRFALNGVIRDRNEIGRIQNEESNELCVEFSDSEHQDKYNIKIINCCGDVFIHQYSNDEELNDIITLLSTVETCDAAIHDTNKWNIDGIQFENKTPQQIYEYISERPYTDYILSAYGCRESRHKIRFHSCCDDEVIEITVNEEYFLNPDVIEEYFGRTKYGMVGSFMMLGKQYDRDCIAHIYGGNSQIGEEGADFYNYQWNVVSITMDTDVYFECLIINPIETVLEIEREDSYPLPDGNHTIATNLSFDPCGYDVLHMQNVQNTAGSHYIAFRFSAGSYMSEYLEVSFNGVKLPKKDSFNTIDKEYWYLVPNDEVIIIKFYIDKNNVNQFKFSIPSYLDTIKIINLISLFEIKLFDMSGFQVGSFDPSGMIIEPYQEDITINGVLGSGLIGRMMAGGVPIQHYYVYNLIGEKVAIKTDHYFLNIIYNNIIYVSN